MVYLNEGRETISDALRVTSVCVDFLSAVVNWSCLIELPTDENDCQGIYKPWGV